MEGERERPREIEGREGDRGKWREGGNEINIRKKEGAVVQIINVRLLSSVSHPYFIVSVYLSLSLKTLIQISLPSLSLSPLPFPSLCASPPPSPSVSSALPQCCWVPSSVSRLLGMSQAFTVFYNTTTHSYRP